MHPMIWRWLSIFVSFALSVASLVETYHGNLAMSLLCAGLAIVLLNTTSGKED